MSEIELEPCPFCGGKAAMQDAYLAGIMGNEPDVYCGNCSFSLPPERWNTRSQSERVSRLEEERDSALVRLYHHDPMEVARLCDEEFDRSCALLGRIRKRARSALNQGADDGQ